MTRPYQPSNGTEGEGFVGHFCDRCLHDRAVRLHEDYANGCPILARAFAFKPGNPDFPDEWIQDDNGDNPRCTAFIEDDHDDDWEPPPSPDPTQLVLIADPTEDIANITPAPKEVEVFA